MSRSEYQRKLKARQVDDDRKPFHETIIAALEEVIHEDSDLLGVPITIKLMKLLNQTRVPKEHLKPLIEKLNKLAKQVKVPSPIKDAANRLDAEYQRIIQ